MKKVLIGVTGSISAYKVCDLIRMLQNCDFIDVDIDIVMTQSACELASPLTFSALIGHDVYVDVFDNFNDPIPHIKLANQSDVICVCPASANTIAKIAHGFADNLLTSTILASNKPLIICPAMNDVMYANVATQENLDTLRKRGVIIVEPSVGKLACGSVGKGHLASIQNIVDAISYNLYIEKPLAGKNVLITAGPTREYLDPVRFISNGSSGKFGYALARAAKCLGANVTLLSGPTNIDIPADVEFVQATSAKDMFEFITGHSSFFDIAIFNAAVCDWAAKDYSFEKITKTGNDLNLEFAQNSDIAQYFGQHKSSKQTSVIFNAQTSLDEQQSIQKLINKNADLVVSNIVGGKNNALASDVDDISIFNAEKLIAKYKDSKSKLAFIIFEEVIKRAMDDHIS